MAKSENIITSVKEDSIAWELQIEPGDILIAINGQAVKDIIDYKYLISDEYIELLIKKQDGEEWIYEVEKEYDEDIGIEFGNPIIDKARSCSNRCIFCFIDQLPRGMRKTLYFKDDDSRLSFLQGNFITLTNMSDEDIERIIKYRISPLNISVHTTDPELRIKMLGNKKAGNILDILKRMIENSIKVNCQIVLCRGINDGDNLIKTIKDLYELYPGIGNVAVVPIGITKYREKLFPLVSFDRESSGEVIDIIETLQQDIIKKTGSPFARCADEFYIMAGRPLPAAKHYGDFEQLEDGVGMITYFEENINKSIKDLKLPKLQRTISVITGVSSYFYVNKACKNIEEKIEGLKINTFLVKNYFFGETITVTGLLTGKDIIEQLKDKDLGEFLMVPSNILKSGETILLDDVTISEVEDKLEVRIQVCNYDGTDFVQRIIE